MLRKLLLFGMVFIMLASCARVAPGSLPVVSIPTTISQALSSPGFRTPQSTPSASPQGSISSPSPVASPQADKTPTGTAISTLVPSPTATAIVTATATASASSATTDGNIKTVFVIVMENHNWSDIYKNPSAPYINQTLLPQASYATQYFNPPGNHPSEPNYLWLEAGKSFGVKNDEPPASNHQSSTSHLVTLLDKAGISWKAYLEGISGKDCPLTGGHLYTPHHNPMLFFDDVTGNNDSQSKNCIHHLRPYTELQHDLSNSSVAQYNFITPNLCNDMHNTDGCNTQDSVKNGDTWLSEQIPMIMKSNAYQQGGAIFILWDESDNGDQPIGMIVLSPFAKGGGYSNAIHYTHSSTLRTIEEIFGVTPLLGDAAKATDLSDLFTKFP